MGTYVAISTISPEFREAHFQALKPGGKLPEDISAQAEAHMQYDKELKAKGKLIAAGPTVAFTWGLKLLRADSLEEAKLLAENDPGIKSGLLIDLKVEAWYHVA